jgi:hypothetical protein
MFIPAPIDDQGYRVLGAPDLLASAPAAGRSLRLAENHHAGLERPPASIFAAILGLQTPSSLLKTNVLRRFLSGVFWHGSCFAIYGVNLTFFGSRTGGFERGKP